MHFPHQALALGFKRPFHFHSPLRLLAVRERVGCFPYALFQMDIGLFNQAERAEDAAGKRQHEHQKQEETNIGLEMKSDAVPPVDIGNAANVVHASQRRERQENEEQPAFRRMCFHCVMRQNQQEGTKESDRQQAAHHVGTVGYRQEKA